MLERTPYSLYILVTAFILESTLQGRSAKHTRSILRLLRMVMVEWTNVTLKVIAYISTRKGIVTVSSRAYYMYSLYETLYCNAH